MPDDMEESEESEDADDEVTVIFSRGKMDFLSPLGSRRCFFWEDCYGVFVSLFVCLFVCEVFVDGESWQERTEGLVRNFGSFG